MNAELAPRLIPIPGLYASAQANWQHNALFTTLVGDHTGLRLPAEPKGPLALNCADDSLGRLTLPRGLAIDHERRVYLLDRSRQRVYRHDPSNPRYDLQQPFVALPLGGLTTLERERDEPRQFVAATAIAVDRDCLYVVDQGSRRIVLFALETWAMADVLTLPDHAEPIDVGVHRNALYVVSPTSIYRFRRGETEATRLPITPQPTPWSRLALDQHGHLYLRAHDESRVWRYDPQYLSAGEPITDAATVRNRFPFSAIYTVPDKLDARTYVMPESLTRPCHRSWPTPPDVGPVESGFAFVPYDGSKTGAFLFNDHGERVQRSPMQSTCVRLFAQHGAWISQSLDSRIFRCPWDRFALRDLYVPPGSRVSVHTYSAAEILTDAEIQKLPSEAWADCITLAGGQAGQPPQRRDVDGLINSPPERYLWCRLTFVGDGFSSPLLPNVEVHFPRRSMVRDLPAVFSEDEASRRFLERFMAVFQHDWDALERRADRMAQYFDPVAVPDSHLDYLASWLGTAFDNGWSNADRRHLLTQLTKIRFAERRANGAPRGTRRGTVGAVRDDVAALLLVFARHHELPEHWFPFIIEGYRERDYRRLAKCPDDEPARLPEPRDVPQTPLWGANTVGRFQLGGGGRLGENRLLPMLTPANDAFAVHAHRFRVVVPAAWIRTPAAEAALRRAIDAEKPAHTAYELQQVSSRFIVGVQASLGIDTIVGASPESRLSRTSRLNDDTVLPERETEQRVRLGPSTRLGIDSVRL